MEGLIYRTNFVSVEEERRLLEALASLDFHEVRMHGVVARRRIVQFGWRYSFDSRALTAGPTLPGEFVFLQERVAQVLALPAGDLSEVLLTEYRPGATIGWHRDAPPFGIVAGLSLAAACRMRFRCRKEAGWERETILLEPRSLYVLGGAARSSWQHSIPPVDALRYSITFRTLRPSKKHPAALSP